MGDPAKITICMSEIEHSPDVDIADSEEVEDV